MYKYLWNIPLSGDSCGWFDTYYNAFCSYPDGKKIYLGDEEYFVNPVNLYREIQQLFNFYKNKAIKLSDTISNKNFKQYIPELIDCDVCLYGLIYDWQLPAKLETDPCFFIPNTYTNGKSFRNYTSYIRNGNLFPSIDKLRIINHLKMEDFSNGYSYVLPIEP